MPGRSDGLGIAKLKNRWNRRVIKSTGFAVFDQRDSGDFSSFTMWFLEGEKLAAPVGAVC